MGDHVDDSVWSVATLMVGISPVPQPLAASVVSGLAVDSRCAGPGELFFALSGSHAERSRHIDEALQRGAIAAVVEATAQEVAAEGGSRRIVVDNLPVVLGQVASRYHHDPSASLKIAAVTGTDGKSSVAWLIASAMEQLQGGAAVLGTVENRMMDGAPLGTVTHTTPPPLALQPLLQQIVARGGKMVALEASSHGIEQQRLAATRINTAVLTQVGRDHLDYHGSEAAYRAAKRQLFYRPELESIVVNLDDQLGAEVAAAPPAAVTVIDYSLQQQRATLFAEVVAQERSGLQLQVHYRGEVEPLHSPLFGQFNASNLLAALGVLLLWGYPIRRAIEALQGVAPPQGRMEPFLSPRTGAPQAGHGLPLVDYAHTPGALQAALQAARQHLASGRGQLWVVFGCGGDRDRGKRPQMGAVAERLADRVVVTSDNPRSEPAQAIIDEILQGMEQPQQALVVVSREEAIVQSYCRSGADDVLLIAGKGHEQYQQIGERRLPFSDREVVRRLVSGEGGCGE
jgi:UDP-N-acetylmuramoyl-L-alanyl-D-glutamate--2,6-diaminopimelate ligase